MGIEPSFEDAVTTGMHALADEIARSIDTALGGAILRGLRALAALAWWRRAAPVPPTG